MLLPPPTSSLFPYTTLFRSGVRDQQAIDLGYRPRPHREVRITKPEHERGSGQRSRCPLPRDRKSTRLNSSHQIISYAVFCLKKKKQNVLYFFDGFLVDPRPP